MSVHSIIQYNILHGHFLLTLKSTMIKVLNLSSFSFSTIAGNVIKKQLTGVVPLYTSNATSNPLKNVFSFRTRQL